MGALSDVLRLAGQTVGIVGYGDIGREVAWRAHAMGMRVFALKRHLPPAGSDLGPVEKMYPTSELHEMIATCDYVVVAAPLTAETHHLIADAEFAAMKPDAVIINVGRGPVIDESAMVQALAEGKSKAQAWTSSNTSRCAPKAHSTKWKMFSSHPTAPTTPRTGSTTQ